MCPVVCISQLTSYVSLLHVRTLSTSAISRDQLLGLVRPLFGPGDSDLLAEFSRLLSSREDYTAHQQDMWYAVPMSEIDFNQCRKCSPSYRLVCVFMCVCVHPHAAFVSSPTIETNYKLHWKPLQ